MFVGGFKTASETEGTESKKKLHAGSAAAGVAAGVAGTVGAQKASAPYFRRKAHTGKVEKHLKHLGKRLEGMNKGWANAYAKDSVKTRIARLGHHLSKAKKLF